MTSVYAHTVMDATLSCNKGCCSPSVSDAKQGVSQKRPTNPGMAKPRIPSPDRVRFLAESRGNAYPNAKVQIQGQCRLCGAMTSARSRRVQVRASRLDVLAKRHAHGQSRPRV